MPFRSETEQLRERLRRVEEQESELREEKAALEREAEPQTRGRGWIGLTVFGLIVASLSGYGIGALAVSREASRLRAIQDREEAEDLDRERTRLVDCRMAAAGMRAQVESCEREVADKRRRPVEPELRPPPSPCYCRDGDPLCDCPFDREAAVAALGAAESPVGRCIALHRTSSFRTTITFAPNGSVSSAVVDQGPFPGTPVGGCIAGKFRAAHIPPFAGGAVKAGKSFTIN